jgi:hypothetical protein
MRLLSPRQKISIPRDGANPHSIEVLPNSTTQIWGVPVAMRIVLIPQTRRTTHKKPR